MTIQKMLTGGCSTIMEEIIESGSLIKSKEEELESKKAQEVIDQLLQKPGEASSDDDEIEDESVEESGTLEVSEQLDSSVIPKFADGQAVQLEDGTTAFLHTTPRDGYQTVQLEDGTLAYLSPGDIFGEFENLTTEVAVDCEIKDEQVEVKEVKPKSGKVFQCDYPNCDRMYTTYHHLKVHERAHTGDRPYKCGVCPKAFATSYGLKSHTRVHTGETPYKCSSEGCYKAFKTSGDLQKHTRTHTGERPFKCTFPGCDRAFTTSNIRKMHVRTHTGERPYTCSVGSCRRAFASATNYKNHMRIHTGEKPYVCFVSGCGRRFTEYSSLYKHNVVHTHSKPYACSYCGKNYRQISTLTMHKRVMHGITDAAEDKRQEELEVEEERAEEIEIDDIQEDEQLEAKSGPNVVTLQKDSSRVQHPVYTVQISEDGTVPVAGQQIVLVADAAQLAALQTLAQNGGGPAIFTLSPANVAKHS